MKDFLLELSRDFCFAGSEYSVQVGGQDFTLDLLSFHRGLNALVAFELKVGRFESDYLSKLNFDLEAHERPSIGVLLCASENDEVVEYAMSRTLSPALIAEYQTLQSRARSPTGLSTDPEGQLITQKVEPVSFSFQPSTQGRDAESPRPKRRPPREHSGHSLSLRGSTKLRARERE
jgi:hypothetical protein